MGNCIVLCDLMKHVKPTLHIHPIHLGLQALDKEFKEREGPVGSVLSLGKRNYDFSFP